MKIHGDPSVKTQICYLPYLILNSEIVKRGSYNLPIKALANSVK